MTVIAKSALVPYSAEEMYALVADIEAYPLFLPWCSGTRILSRDQDVVVATIQIAYKVINKQFTTENRGSPGKSLEMRLRDGPFQRLHGWWQFLALDTQASKISLDLDFAFSSRLLDFTVGPTFGSIANTMVDSFRQRAERVYGRR